MSIFSKYYQRDVSQLIKLLSPKNANVIKITYKDINKKLPNKMYDYIFLVDSLSYADDIQNEVTSLKKNLSENGRVVVISFNFFWKPLLDLATNLSLREKISKEPNWLTPEDISNLFYLESFEEVRKGRRFLLPINLGLISAFINKFVAQIPLINYFCLTNYQVFRLHPTVKNYSSSIIIPARNEAGNIRGVLNKIPKLGTDTEVIFIEGHSTDNTYATIQEEIQLFKSGHFSHLSSVALYKQKGKGKGDAVRLGFQKAKNEVLMILDADLTVDPSNLPKFYYAISRGHAEFANGSRLVYRMEEEAMQTLNYFGNKFFSIAFTYLLGQNIKDTLCGTKVLLKKDYVKIAKNRAFFGDFDPFGDFDLLFGASKLNLKIAEIPIRYKERTYGTTNISRFTHSLLLFKMVFFAARKIKFV